LTEAFKKSRNKYKDHVYAIPEGFGTQGLFIRTDWFKEIGHPESVDTWDDYFDLAKKLTDKSKGRYGISFRGGANGILRAMEYIVNELKTDSWFDQDGKSILYKPEAFAAFKKFYSVYQDGYAPKESINWGFNEMVQGFMNGQTGILNQTPEVIATAQKNMKEGTWTVVPMPKASDGKRYISWGFTAGYAMSSKSEHKNESWKLIEFLSSPEVNLEYCIKNTYLPIYKQNLQDPFFANGPISGYAKAMADTNLVFSAPPSHLTKLGQFSGTFAVEEVQKYLTGKQSAEDTVTHLADFLTKEQQAYLKDNLQK
jgi:multiple sugar transport system substrate-binding protein